MNASALRVAPRVVLAATLAAVPGQAQAHHSTLPFDGQHATTVSGVVTGIDWRNPHSYVRLDVKNAAGKIEQWSIETEGLILLRRLGWVKDVLKPGDSITTTGARARDGSPVMRCQFIVLTDGRQLPCVPS